jgi:hypothetical protein
VTRYGPCMCGATDCPSCGSAQGYEVVRVWSKRDQQWTHKNPDDIEEGDIREEDYPPREYEE